MDDQLPCVKTPKGIEEIEQRTYRLPMRTRQVLIMIDGKRDRATLSEMFPGDGLPGILQFLLDEGFVRPLQRETPAPAPGAEPSAPAKPSRPQAPAPADAAQRYQMARNFMVNTTSAFIGVSGSSLISQLESCPDIDSLRHRFKDWREAIQLSNDGRRQLADLEERLAALLS